MAGKKRKSLSPIGQSILPKRSNGKRIDGRSASGRRLKAIAYELAEQTPDSDTPLVRSRILSAAALCVEAERLAWEIGQGHTVDAEELRKADEAAHRALLRLTGKGLHIGRHRDDGSKAQPRDFGNGTHAKSLGAKLKRRQGITEKRFLQ